MPPNHIILADCALSDSLSEQTLVISQRPTLTCYLTSHFDRLLRPNSHFPCMKDRTYRVAHFMVFTHDHAMLALAYETNKFSVSSV